MPKIRVLVVDDAVVMRKMITEVLARDPQIEVAGTAANGSIALQKIPQINPDLITLDVEMPEMDGIQTLTEIRKSYPTLPVIMFSTLTAKGGVTTLEALSRGATDYVTKPANVGSVGEGIQRLETELIPKIKAHCRHLRAGDPPGDHTQFVSRIKPVVLPQRTGIHPVEILCIGTSTGGPNALAEVFKGFPGDFPIPIVVVQHMPPMFTALLAERLAAHSGVRFQEGRHGQVIEPGCGYVAPGGKHMEVKRDGLRAILQLHEGPPENSCRPAVDVLFRSVAAAYGSRTLGVILTGMGQDGLRGCQHLREQHGQVIAQDEKTSVVWGMPGCVVQAGLADAVVPLARVREEIVRRALGSRVPRAA
ncbi:MAG TPA: chemotaxis response regulator protein-glutamate methylesterase [Verrucomicrobiales bacterium]|nr:chemotaxis response regulator protein-glutamate methylesterase [Verrucomicrobiales bacterium]